MIKVNVNEEKNLFSEESYRLGIDWLFYIIYRCNASNDYSFPLLCNTEIEEIAIWEWGSDWLFTVHVVAVHLMIISSEASFADESSLLCSDLIVSKYKYTQWF